MSSGGGGGGVGLMSCVREGSVEPPYRPPHIDTGRHGEGRTGRFFRGLRRMFKRRGSGARVDASPDPKSSSTSELLDADRTTRRKEGAYGSGLSVSHDSVFTGERSGDESDDRPSPGRGARLTNSHRAELVAAVRRRGRGDGSDDDDDPGLPRSPPASPPTDKADKRHHAGISHSSCSDGSLLSVGSSEMDEDSSSTHHNDLSNRSDLSDVYNSSEPPTGVAPLSHSAARHKMAVRPRRTHGAPRRIKNSPMATSALPITPELNEEMIRSATPEVTHKTSEVVAESFSSSTTTKHQGIVKEHQQQLNRELQRVIEVNEAKLKSCSLPPGLALSQMTGQMATKMSIAEDINTPRSSVKRSKSSSQGKSLRDDSPKTHASTSESQIYKERRYKENHAEETCLNERKTKSEKKSENEIIKAKKEESFFSRLLLRKSGKKGKKDPIDSEQETKKNKSEKVTHQYKVVDNERSNYVPDNPPLGPKPIPAERTNKSAGQRVFANQMHRRMDNKGAYVQEGVYKDAYSAAKVPGIEYNITDLKVADETDRMLNREMRNRFSRRDEYNEKVIEMTKRTSSKEANDDSNKRDSFNLSGHERSKKMVLVPKPIDAFSSKSFIDNELAHCKREQSFINSDEDPPLKAPRIKATHNELAFHSGSVPKNIPYFNTNQVSASVSPPKTAWKNSEHVRPLNRSSEHVTEFGREKQIAHIKKETTSKIKHVSSTDDTYSSSGLRSLGEEFVDTRSSIGKSHSFRYASETTSSISSQESQMPSLPAIVGISEPYLESWEVNYRRNVAFNSESFSNRHDFAKRVSARNYILQANAETNYDSLPSTDSSYMDSLKDTQVEEAKSLFGNTIHVPVDNRKRNSDISQIEAKIDDIISSPKPIIASILKSSSLDSVKSTPEKNVDDRRKTISVATTLSNDGEKISENIVKKEPKLETENFVSVTLLNREQSPVLQTTPPVDIKITKSDEKLQKSPNNKNGDPEFLKIKLNKVDAKPSTNVVLTANITPKKIDTPQYDNDQDIDVEIIENKKISSQTDIVTVNKYSELKDAHIENNSPVCVRKSTLPPSPSTPKAFFKRKSISVDLQDKPEKVRTQSVSTEGSTEKIFDTISMDRKSHSSYGSKSSIQSSDSNEIRTPDRHEETVVYRKKPITLVKERSGKKKDDEPELMKVFARRSLKLKDSEAETIAQEIAELRKEENGEYNKTKSLKNEFNASIKSRDSDKENDDSTTKSVESNRIVDIAARVSQFGAPHCQRSVSTNSVVPNPKRESAPTFKTEVNKYKKEVSDSTPEKRLRNRTFPDPSNDRDKNEPLTYKADTLSKRPWQKTEENKINSSETEDKSKEAVIERNGEMERDEEEREGEADDSPQFKGILQMRAEWERRAKQGMTK